MNNYDLKEDSPYAMYFKQYCLNCTDQKCLVYLTAQIDYSIKKTRSVA